MAAVAEILISWECNPSIIMDKQLWWLNHVSQMNDDKLPEVVN